MINAAHATQNILIVDREDTRVFDRTGSLWWNLPSSRSRRMRQGPQMLRNGFKRSHRRFVRSITQTHRKEEEAR